MHPSNHNFQPDSHASESKTKIVMVLTFVTMVAEIFAGKLFNSMALLADGWHMGTHLFAFVIAIIAYRVARKNRDNVRFTFGTGKIEVLGAFVSSVLLMVVAVGIFYESVLKLFHPSEINFKEALIVAIIGFVVNIVCAYILRDNHHHHRDHHHGHDHGKAHQHTSGSDKNLKAAYIHVVTDAFTSVTAIVALLIGAFSGIAWVDAAVGILGSVVIVWWAIGLLKETAPVLVDYTPSHCDLEEEIRKDIDSLADTKIVDLHIWQVASDKYATIISLETSASRKTKDYYELINRHEELVHVTIQIV